MRLALQSSPVPRAVRTIDRAARRGVSPSDCIGVPGNILGTCFFDDGPPVGRYNCQACCALRHATGWTGDAYVRTC